MSHLAGINEQRFAGLFLTFCNEPQSNRNCHAIKKLGRHCDNAFNQIILDDFLSDFTFAAALRRQRTIRQYQTDFPIRSKVMNHMLNPCVVGITCRRQTVFPTLVFFQFFLSPRMIIEWGISENKVCFQCRMQVTCKCIRIVWSQISINTSDCHIHFRHLPSIRVCFLPIH